MHQPSAKPSKEPSSPNPDGNDTNPKKQTTATSNQKIKKAHTAVNLVDLEVPPPSTSPSLKKRAN